MRIDTRTPPLRRALTYIGTALTLVGIVMYIGFQARNLIHGPSLTLTDQDTFTAVQHERTTTINGTARNIVKLTFNGKEIHTDPSGTFSHTFVLERGYSIISLVAHDRFGRTASIERSYVYVPIATTTDAV